MSRNQVQSVVLNRCDQTHEATVLSEGQNNATVKVNVGRSNSAPQSKNRFTREKMGLSSKPADDMSPKKQVPNGSHNSLSEGVVLLVDPEQAAGGLVSVASTSNKLYHKEDTSMVRAEPKPDDVWQRRKKFCASGRSQELDSPELNKRNGTLFEDSNASAESLKGATADLESIESNKLTACEETCHSTLVNERDSRFKQSGPENPEADCRKHTQRYPFRQAHSEVILPSASERRLSLAHVKEKGYARLEEELMKAQKALEMKDEEVGELRGIRERLMKEVSDFTAALFEEVNSQLNSAALSEQQAKKQLQEANAKIDVLIAEVAALKDLVLTSTPSSPNKHLHPQIDSPKKDKGGKPFWKTHRRSTSHHQFTKESREKAEATQHHSQLKEMDTVAFDEFSRWRLQPTMEFTGQFFTRVQQEDIHPCLNFKNTRLAERILESVKNNTLSIEPIPGDHSFPRKCCLSDTHKLCNYKIKFEGDDEWYSISQMSRNRIAVVCDFFSYLRYIVQGLVKCSDKDMYAELVRLRGQMALARLGLI